MNEEIRKDAELRDDELENVSGGVHGYISCPRCGGAMRESVPMVGVPESPTAYLCPECRYYYTE